MSNFTAITHLNFEFGPHHSLKNASIDTALNNMYSEPIEGATLASLFIDANRTAFKADAVDLICSAIFANVVHSSRADQPTIEPLLTIKPLSTRASSPKTRFTIRGPSTLALAFQV